VNQLTKVNDDLKE